MVKLKLISEIFKNQGPKYVAYRAWYEFRRKNGWLKKKFPVSPSIQEFISLKKWKEKNIPFFFQSKKELNLLKSKNSDLDTRFAKINRGEVFFFNSEWKKLTGENAWITNPDSGHQYDINKHWTEVEDISKKAGDIKFVWEKSRFSYFYDIIRHDYHFDAEHGELVFSEIESWMEANPLNQGPNYKCSQEISLRCMNWIFALYYYKDSEALSDLRFRKILHFIYWQIKHVYSNINFSRICVRNNHAITETLMLYIGGLLFPFFPESSEWKTKGKKWFEEEIEYQVYDDGTFLQFSHNYQRVLVQLLTWGIGLCEKHGEKLSSTTYEKASKVVEYMKNCCVGKNGEMPNYGNNDGALFYRLNNQNYSDFRAQINALEYSLNGKVAYKENSTQEDVGWYFSNISEIEILNENQKLEVISNFTEGGINTIHLEKDNSFTFFKCTNYIDRPWQADNMHVDIWINGENYLRDSGTYKYNTSEELINYFAGTKGHNCLLVDSHNQMTKGPRFIWYDWTKEASLINLEDENKLGFKAKASMFQSTGQKIEQTRIVNKFRKSAIWEIQDSVKGKRSDQKIRQCWHPNPELEYQINISATNEKGEKLKLIKELGHYSDHYGKMVDAPIWLFETNENQINTKIEILV